MPRPTYSGYDLFLDEPNWISELTHKYDHPYELIRFIGLEHSGSKELKTSFNVKGLWTFFTKAEIADMTAFFDSKRGRLNPFFLPSWQPDLRVTEAFTAFQSYLIIEPCEYADFWPVGLVGRDIIIVWPDQSYVCKHIESAPNDHTVGFGSVIGKGCTEADMPHLRVSFLYFVRFDLDVIEADYCSPEIADFDLAFQGLPLG